MTGMRMQRFLCKFGLIFATFALFGALRSHAETAEEMLSACRPIAQARVSDGKIDLPQTFDAGSCWGAFAALHQVTMLLENGKPSLHVCLPEDTTRTELIALFVRYVESHPKVYSENFALVAMNAMIEAFPCK
jgi:hypothetical protein